MAMTGPGGGPLAGIRVVELAGIGPCPFCAMLFADLGAEVIRVDRPGPPPLAAPDVTSRGKKRVVVDLKHPRGAEVVLRLAKRSDALLEGYRPGVAERLGVGPADCQARNPRLVYGRMTGWARTGRSRNRPGTTSPISRSPARCTRSAGPTGRRRSR